MRFVLRLLIASALGLVVSYIGHRFRERNKPAPVVAVAKPTVPETGYTAPVAPQSAREEREKKEPEKIWMTGFMWVGKRVNVTLSDGRVLTEKDGSIVRVERNFVELITGERYWMRTPKSVPVSVGAGGGSPPDRQRAEAAADDVAQLTGRSATVGEGVEVVGTSNQSPTSTPPSGSTPGSSGQTFGRIARTAPALVIQQQGKRPAR
jgi:hypothetical protein